MTSAESDHINNWLIKANEDIAVISQLLDNHPEQYTGAICFHCQQAVEKFLKAYLIYKKIEFRRTHDLDYLLSECMKQETKDFSDIELKSLTDYGTGVRYPDDFIIPEIEDAKEYCEIAQQIKTVVESKIVF